ncbi:hypothetical protein J6590_067120 [Homalodisca vitripennis]|nr:hypothetical protein J6590_067120 [Homalodisca vitripennis]
MYYKFLSHWCVYSRELRGVVGWRLLERIGIRPLLLTLSFHQGAPASFQCSREPPKGIVHLEDRQRLDCQVRRWVVSLLPFLIPTLGQ